MRRTSIRSTIRALRDRFLASKGPRSAGGRPPPPPDVRAEIPARRDFALRLHALETAIAGHPEDFARHRRVVASLVAKATVLSFTGRFGDAMDAIGEARAVLVDGAWNADLAAVSRLRVEFPPPAERPRRGARSRP